MIKSLRKKFILINMLLVFVVMVIVFSVQYISTFSRLQDESIQSLERELNRKGGQKPSVFEIGHPRPADFVVNTIFVVLTDQNEQIELLAGENISISEEQLRKVVTDVLLSKNRTGLLKNYNLRYMIKEERDFSKIAFIDLTDDIATMRNTLIILIFSCVAALTAFFFISLYLSGWAMRPVEQAWEQQRRFVADASHELKTPLTVILANTRILKSNRSATVEQQINWVENTQAEADRMKKLIDNLLFLAKTDDTELPVAHNKVNLSDIFLNSALAFESVAFEKGIFLEADAIAPDIYVLGNEAQLKQLVGILLDNAVKYSKKDGVVTLTLELKQSKAALTVHNHGECLTQEDSEHIFDRFYRADKSRSAEGYGLGLSIAKRVVEAHAGKISVQSGTTHGITFVVLLPLY